jgi:hypothetical protein
VSRLDRCPSVAVLLWLKMESTDQRIYYTRKGMIVGTAAIRVLGEGKIHLDTTIVVIQSKF